MIDLFLKIGLSNACFALALAIVAMVVGKTTKRPHLANLLWLLVLVKLVTPPLVTIPCVAIVDSSNTSAAVESNTHSEPPVAGGNLSEGAQATDADKPAPRRRQKHYGHEGKRRLRPTGENRGSSFGESQTMGPADLAAGKHDYPDMVADPSLAIRASPEGRIATRAAAVADSGEENRTPIETKNNPND